MPTYLVRLAVVFDTDHEIFDWLDSRGSTRTGDFEFILSEDSHLWDHLLSSGVVAEYDSDTIIQRLIMDPVEGLVPQVFYVRAETEPTFLADKIDKICEKRIAKRLREEFRRGFMVGRHAAETEDGLFENPSRPKPPRPKREKRTSRKKRDPEHRPFSIEAGYVEHIDLINGSIMLGVRSDYQSAIMDLLEFEPELLHPDTERTGIWFLITRLRVPESMRRQGIGSFLYAKASEIADKYGFGLETHVAPIDRKQIPILINMLEKAGFQEGEVPGVMIRYRR